LFSILILFCQVMLCALYGPLLLGLLPTLVHHTVVHAREVTVNLKPLHPGQNSVPFGGRGGLSNLPFHPFLKGTCLTLY
jgi:hypothetical protein